MSNAMPQNTIDDADELIAKLRESMTRRQLAESLGVKEGE